MKLTGADMKKKELMRKLKAIDEKIEEIKDDCHWKTGSGDPAEWKEHELQADFKIEWHEDYRRSLLTQYWKQKAKKYFIPMPAFNETNWKEMKASEEPPFYTEKSYVLTDHGLYSFIKEILAVTRNRLLRNLTIISTVFGVIGTIIALFAVVKK